MSEDKMRSVTTYYHELTPPSSMSEGEMGSFSTYPVYEYSTPTGQQVDTGLMAEARPVSIFDSPMSSRHSTDESTAAVDYCQQTAPDMYSVYNTTTLFSTTQLNRFWHEKVIPNKLSLQQCAEEVAVIVQNILRHVQIEEPRFACTLNKTANGKYDGMTIESPTTFSILLYLNHMAVFNFIDERNLPGCAALKLCDGRKRSMSLWVEFITASGDYRNDRL
ncbi:MAB21L1 [Bugula neritina]|uniref:MAB21L1 n=1 Tax=Bugula neritina TaxID=10212 RepID=A0A7J7K5M6_BUGNE|nr:MAB21L1 [Bugula neritina]